MIKAILFDFYGVLRPDTYISWLASKNLTRTGEFQVLSEKLDTNEITSTQFFEALGALTKQSSSSIQNEFTNIQAVQPEVYAWLDTLKQKYKLGLISNGSLKTRQRLTDDGLAEYFDAIIISAEIGIIKPNPTIYQQALKQLNVDVDEVVYTDDNIDNITAARKLGIKSILFVSLEDTKKQLTNLDDTAA